MQMDVAPGEIIMEQGAEGDNLYVIESGLCEVLIQGKGVVHRYDNEGSFGELALMYNAPRAATVQGPRRPPCLHLHARAMLG